MVAATFEFENSAIVTCIGYWAKIPVQCNFAMFIVLFPFVLLGPALGSLLYEAGGFTLPFLVVGIWCFLSAIGILFAIPNVNIQSNTEVDSDKPNKKLGLKDLIKVRWIILV